MNADSHTHTRLVLVLDSYTVQPYDCTAYSSKAKTNVDAKQI